MTTLPLVALTLVLSTQGPTPAPYVNDSKTVDSMVKALYEVISGPAGKKRDWDRFRAMFVPESRMTVSALNSAGKMVRISLTPEDYVTRIGPQVERDGFFEKELNRRTEQFAEIAHVFSTYETKRAESDEKPLARGINSIQLWNDGTRWWILTVYWQAEGPGRQIPIKYLPDPPSGQ